MHAMELDTENKFMFIMISYMTIFGEVLDSDEEDMCMWITVLLGNIMQSRMSMMTIEKCYYPNGRLDFNNLPRPATDQHPLRHRIYMVSFD
jgi:hypothetical protein